MGLLHADLSALANLPATPAGRRVVVSTCFGLALLGLMWWSIAAAMLDHPQLLRMIHTHSQGDSLRGLLGIGFLPCPIAATWLGLALAQRQLFETPELTLWRLAPVPGWRGAVQVLLRAGLVATLWASALSVPFVAMLLSRSAAPALAWLLLPVAVCCCTLPILCTLLAVQIVLVRFFAGRLLRLVLAVVAALASVGFSTWLLLGLFTPTDTRLQGLAATASAPDRLPWTIDAAAALMHSAAVGGLDWPALAASLGWLGLSASLFALAARLHPLALERHLEAQAPLLRRLGARWPGGVAATIRRKEFAQVLQQPGALIGFLVFAVLVFALARERVLVGSLLANWQLPRDVAHFGAMLSQWFLAVLLVLYAHMGRLALWDGAQWSLYMTAPAAPRAILFGKLQAVAVFLLWPLVLVGAAGSHAFEASGTALLAFVGVALGGTLAALGVLAIVGTSPRLMRPDDGGQIVQGGRSFVAAMLLVLLFEIAVAPAVFGWWWLADHARVHGLGAAAARAAAPWVVVGAWLHGAVVGSVGIAIGTRNYRRLSQAR